uniref:Uncharacterized protein n=1 Tax=Rhizophora mucronata TaxID=61149 RepID=A0A2P2IMQ0_RHIMU
MVRTGSQRSGSRAPRTVTESERSVPNKA